jgi:predicted metal-dependent HD superfamily phosphohydrolase
MQMDEIDRNADFSPDAKYHQRSKAAAQAIADLEASKTLARAREAVEVAVAKHDIEQHVSPEIAQARDATRKALKEAEHGWQRAIDKIAERASLTKRPDTGR